MRGLALHQMDQHEEATRHFRRAGELDPRNAAVVHSIFLVSESSGTVFDPRAPSAERRLSVSALISVGRGEMMEDGCFMMFPTGQGCWKVSSVFA